MRISVIVAAYNATGYLRIALGSIATQTRMPEEVIVVDDGSSDGTAELAARWEAVLPMTVVRQVENQGLGAARQAAVERSSGDVLAVLDGDDCWLPDHLEIMAATRLDQACIVTPRYLRWFCGSTAATAVTPARIKLPPVARQRRSILRGNFLFAGSMFDRECLDRAGGYRALRRSEDWDLWTRMLRLGLPVVQPARPTVLYQIRAGSLGANDGTLLEDIALLEGLREGLSPHERADVDGAVRRRRARLALLEGLEAERRGNRRAARRAWVRAAVVDRNLRGGLGGLDGSVALRAGLFLVAPKRMVARRDLTQLAGGGTMEGHAGSV